MAPTAPPTYTVQPAHDHFVVLDDHGNFFAKTYSSVDAAHIAAMPQALDLLKRLLSWGQEHTSPMDNHSPHGMLVEAHHLLVGLDAPPNIVTFPVAADPVVAEIIEEVTEPPPPKRENITRDEAIKRIRAGLQKRTGRTWSVTGGRGTAYGWLRIDAPPKRRTAHYVRKPGAPDVGMENYDEVIDATKPGGHITPDDRKVLTEALGLAREVHHQGESIAARNDYYLEYVDRAEGRTPRVIGTPYWD